MPMLRQLDSSRAIFENRRMFERHALASQLCIFLAFGRFAILQCKQNWPKENNPDCRLRFIRISRLVDASCDRFEFYYVCIQFRMYFGARKILLRLD